MRGSVLPAGIRVGRWSMRLRSSAFSARSFRFTCLLLCSSVGITFQLGALFESALLRCTVYLAIIEDVPPLTFYMTKTLDHAALALQRKSSLPDL